MSPSQNQRGAIVLETLACAVGWLLTTTFIFLLSLQVWSRSFVQAESFYLARAQLYAHSGACHATPIISQTFIARNFQCSGFARVAAVYSLQIFGAHPSTVAASLGGR